MDKRGMAELVRIEETAGDGGSSVVQGAMEAKCWGLEQQRRCGQQRRCEQQRCGSAGRYRQRCCQAEDGRAKPTGGRAGRRDGRRHRALRALEARRGSMGRQGP